jgi:hypothetical protein
MKTIPKERLIIRQSFSLPYAGGEIWGEELDALSVYTDIVQDKFLKDLETIRRPSCPAFIAVNLTDTLVDEATATVIANGLTGVERPLKRIAFIGLDGRARRMLDALLKEKSSAFSYAFFTGTEDAKQWLMLIPI